MHLMKYDYIVMQFLSTCTCQSGYSKAMKCKQQLKITVKVNNK